MAGINKAQASETERDIKEERESRITPNPFALPNWGNIWQPGVISAAIGFMAARDEIGSFQGADAAVVALSTVLSVGYGARFGSALGYKLSDITGKWWVAKLVTAPIEFAIHGVLHAFAPKLAHGLHSIRIRTGAFVGALAGGVIAYVALPATNDIGLEQVSKMPYYAAKLERSAQQVRHSLPQMRF